MRKIAFVTVTIMSMVMISCTSKQEKMESRLKELLNKAEPQLKALYQDAAIASWDASISGKSEDYKKSEEAMIKMADYLSDSALFAELKSIKESGMVKDSILNRQMEVLYPAFVRYQVDKKLSETKIKMESELEKKYSNFRASYSGKNITDNEVEEILISSTSTNELEKAWKAHKVIGKEVAAEIIALVKVRNQIAKELGYENYHTMSMILSEQDPEEILKLFDELDNLTAGAFAGLKNEMDEYFAKRFKMPKDKLMPWHYQNRFFQQAPKMYDVDLDQFYTNKDIVVLTEKFFKGINLDISDIIKNSDLFEKPGKNQHAYCIDIDHDGDVRVLCNVKSNMNWMNTMLHEYGHAVYAKYFDPQKPYLLRDAAHTFTTEAIAMIIGRNASNPQWLADMNIITTEQQQQIAETCRKSLRLEQLTFSRWAQVMYRFEKAMYADPDQDLNTLWWKLVEKYQLLKKPEGRNEPDWASKVHVALYPCYYHNYLMGELLASQLFYHISDEVLKVNDYNKVSFVNQPEVGKYLHEKIFMPGMLYKWNEMIEHATGEKLTARYYAKQFVEN